MGSRNSMQRLHVGSMIGSRFHQNVIKFCPASSENHSFSLCVGWDWPVEFLKETVRHCIHHLPTVTSSTTPICRYLMIFAYFQCRQYIFKKWNYFAEMGHLASRWSETTTNQLNFLLVYWRAYFLQKNKSLFLCWLYRLHWR